MEFIIKVIAYIHAFVVSYTPSLVAGEWSRHELTLPVLQNNYVALRLRSVPTIVAVRGL